METVSYFSTWIYFLFAIVFSQLILKSNTSSSSFKYGNIGFVLIFLFAFFRYQIGYDYISYWNMVTDNVRDREDIEITAKLLVSVVRSIGFPPLLFIVYSSVSLIAYKKVINRYSSCVALSWYLYFTYPMFFIQDCSTIRQSAAMGFFFLTYMYYDGNKYIKALFCVLIAALMHNSGIAAILLFLIPVFSRVTLKYNIFLLILSFFSGKLMLTLIQQYFSEWAVVARLLYYVDLEIDGFNTFQYIMYGINLLNLLFYNKLNQINNKNALYITLVNCGLCLFNVLQFESQMAIRMANFFYLFELLIVPSYMYVLKTYLGSFKAAKLFLITVFFALQMMMVVTYIKGYNSRVLDRSAYVPYKTWIFNLE